MKRLGTLIIGFILLLPFGAGAVTYNFSCGTNNSAADCATAESYLSLQVLDTTLGASFTLTNIGVDRTNTKSFWIDDDNGLLDISSSVKSESAGVSYTNLTTSTQNVGGLPSFVAEAEADRVGNADDGVTSGPTATVDPEFLMFDIGLTGTNTFDMLLAALDVGTLRIGVHVIAFASGGSEKLSTMPAVPVPAAFWLFGTALIGFIGISRRTKV